MADDSLFIPDTSAAAGPTVVIPTVGVLQLAKYQLDDEANREDRTVMPEASNVTATVQKLQEIRPLLAVIQSGASQSINAKRTAEGRVQTWVYELRYMNVDQAVIAASGILGTLHAFLRNSNATVRIANEVRDWVEGELKMLYRRWRKGDYLCDPKRGLIRTPRADGNGFTNRYTVDKNWAHYLNPRTFGSNGLVNGQRFYSRQQMSRDGAHGEYIAGICGTLTEGAYSVVMTAYAQDTQYNNRDRLTRVEYMGTKRKRPALPTDINPQPTRSTRVLLQSLQSGRPTRLFRSFEFGTVVNNRPKVQKLYRYDGLYRVTRATLRDHATQDHCFLMERLAGQGRIRGTRSNDEQAALENTLAQNATIAQNNAAGPSNP